MGTDAYKEGDQNFTNVQLYAMILPAKESMLDQRILQANDPNQTLSIT